MTENKETDSLTNLVAQNFELLRLSLENHLRNQFKFNI